MNSLIPLLLESQKKISQQYVVLVIQVATSLVATYKAHLLRIYRYSATNAVVNNHVIMSHDYETPTM